MPAKPSLLRVPPPAAQVDWYGGTDAKRGSSSLAQLSSGIVAQGSATAAQLRNAAHAANTNSLLVGKRAWNSSAGYEMFKLAATTVGDWKGIKLSDASVGTITPGTLTPVTTVALAAGTGEFLFVSASGGDPAIPAVASGKVYSGDATAYTSGTIGALTTGKYAQIQVHKATIASISGSIAADLGNAVTWASGASSGTVLTVGSGDPRDIWIASANSLAASATLSFTTSTRTASVTAVVTFLGLAVRMADNGAPDSDDTFRYHAA